MPSSLPRQVRIVEVGPRDGLQYERQQISTEDKLELIERLAFAGLKTIEATAFVSPKQIPQMADHTEVLRRVKRYPRVSYPVLVPNMKGFEAALAAGAEEVTVFGAASETFSQKNINCSIAESMERFRPVIEAAKRHGLRVRGYVSCVLGCPYQGAIAPEVVAGVARDLFAMGCYEISLIDTTGTGTPVRTNAMLEAVTKHIPLDRIAGHFHDTLGQAMPNIYTSLQAGIAVIDSSIAGLGGHPYSSGVSSNVATEDVVYMLNGLGIETGVDLDRLCEAGAFICARLQRPTQSKVAAALAARQRLIA
jgi:hydroxymethylglutaryl-CoA lyase